VKADPTCGRCYGSLGEALFVKKRYAEAAQAEQVEIGLLPDGASSEKEEERLQKYTKLAALTAGPPKSAPRPAEP
jgi:hypothetical protein